MSRLLCQAELLRRQAEKPSVPGSSTSSPFTESNRRPSPYHGDALPTELKGHSRTGAYYLPMCRARRRRGVQTAPGSGSSQAKGLAPQSEPERFLASDGRLQARTAQQAHPGTYAPVPGGEPGAEPVRRQRSAEQVALRDVAPHLDQPVAAALVLDPLGDDRETELSREPDDRGD